jgi:hypothetical protein
LLTGESEISIKRRGENPDVEIKGLVATLRNERASFAPDVELWYKWRVQASALEITDKVIVRKASKGRPLRPAISGFAAPADFFAFHTAEPCAKGLER